jgi:hypothetical protein
MRVADPQMQTARELFEYWVAKCRSGPDHRPDQILFGPARQKAVLGMLRLGASPERIRLAIDGAALDPYVNPKGKVFDELELICRNEKQLDDFIDRAERAERYGLSLSHTEFWNRLVTYMGQPVRYLDYDVWHFMCPCCVRPEDYLSDPRPRPLTVRLSTSGLKVKCDRCKAEEPRVRAEVAKRKREEIKLLKHIHAEVQEEMAA